MASRQKQLRDQLLSEGSSHPIPTESDREEYFPEMAHTPQQGPQRPLTNHDLMTPVLDANIYQAQSSRKSSMNIRMFRRRPDANFDDDTGADLQDFAINDLTQLRGPDRYNVKGITGTDSAPIIPMLGSFDSNSARKGLNNVQYRKYMNQQKKMNLAQSARAMSMASGGNPMGPNSSRTMSFQNGPYDRAMSLGFSNGPNNRAMSLNSNAYGQRLYPPHQQQQMGQQQFMGQQQHIGPQQHMGQHQQFMGQLPFPQGNGQLNAQGPHRRYGATSPQHLLQYGNNVGPNGNLHTMSLRSNGGFVGQRGPPPLGPRANSMGMRSNPNYFTGNNMGPNGHPQQGMHPNHQQQNGPRTRSFDGNSQRPMYQKAYSGTLSPPIGGSGINSTVNGNSGAAGPFISGQVSPRAAAGFSNGQSFDHSKSKQSTDSLMNVLEEEEEEPKNLYSKQQEDNTLVSVVYTNPSDQDDGTLPPPSPLLDDGDHVYRFDNSQSPQVSRKSTIRKANSKRVRKLDLFSSDADHGDLGKPLSIEDKSTAALSPVTSNTSTSTSKSGTIKSPIRLRSLAANTVFSNFRSALQLAEVSTRAEPQPLDSEKTDLETPTTTATDAKIQDIESNEPSRQNSSHRLSALLSQESSENNKSIQNSTESLKKSEDRVDSQDLPAPPSPAPPSPTQARNLPDVQRRASALSRSNSELKLQGLLPSSSLLRGSSRSGSTSSIPELDDDRKPRLSVSARGLMKKLSMTSLKKTEPENLRTPPAKEPLFTKAELAIMTCNNDLQNELQLITSELAMSIKRELELERLLHARYGSTPKAKELQDVSLAEKAQIIAELQERLNNERRLRFISEEHAILSEHGQSPSALKLDYEKNEIYKQLLVKNDLLTQLQDKVEELTLARSPDTSEELLHKYNELVKENSELKSRLREVEAHNFSNEDGGTDDTSEEESDNDAKQEYERAQITSLRTQRDELREMIVKLTVSQTTELKVAQDRIKTLEGKLEKANSMNAKLNKRLPVSGFENENVTRKSDPFASVQGGKLQGLSIVTPTNKLFD